MKEIKKVFQKIIEIPRTPNFLKLNTNEFLEIEFFSDSELREVGRAWTEDLIKKARERRERGLPMGY